MAVKNDVFGVPINNANLDAFQRLRVSQPDTIFDDKHLYGLNDGLQGDIVWDYVSSGAGAAAEYHHPDSSVHLHVGVNSGERVIKQTLRYFPYIPGKSQLIEMTGQFDAGVANREQRLGYFDDNNGLYFYENSGTVGVAVRTDASGGVTETRIDQSSWNCDRLDGSWTQTRNHVGNESRITANWERSQIFAISFQWLGVGSIFFGVVISGDFFCIHKIHNANILSDPVVYMRTSTLPIRYEIENTGTTVSSCEMDTICATVISEGGGRVTGPSFKRGNGSTLRTNITTREPIFALRNLDTFLSFDNRVTAQLFDSEFYAEGKTTFFELVHLINPTSNDGTWSAVNSASSSLEMSTDVTTFTNGDEHIVLSSVVPSTTKGSATTPNAVAESASDRDNHEFITRDYNGNPQYFVVYATSLGTATSAAAYIDWIEIE